MTLPLLWLSFGFMAGILLGSLVIHSVKFWLILAGGGLVLSMLWQVLAERFNWRPFRIPLAFQLILSLSLTAAMLGAARYQYSTPTNSPFSVAWFNDRDYDILVTGTLAEPPDVRDSYTNIIIHVEKVDTGNELPQSAEGLLLARVSNDVTYHYGDLVRLRGILETPPENEEFSYRAYLAREGIYSYMSDAEVTYLPFRHNINPFLESRYKFLERALAVTCEIFSDPEASLLAGILLGVDQGVPADLQQAFKNTGTAHIVAISGFNIAIIAGLLVALFSRILGEKRSIVLAIVGITLYMILVGADASVVRAAIMGGLGLYARQVGRRQTAINTLGMVAVIMLVFNPLLLWDVGFQLSFGATVGLILYADPFHRTAQNVLSRFLSPIMAERVAQPIAEYFLFTLAAQITMLPIMAYHFKRLSLIAFIANPFVLPVQPAVLVLGGLAVLGGMLWLQLGQIIGTLAWPFAAYTIRMVEWFDKVPGGVITLIDFGFLLVVLYYVVMLALTLFWDKVKPIFSPAVSFSLLSIATLLVWRTAFSAPDQNLHITFLDVGSADAVLIQTPGGRAVLVNGGPSPSKLSDALGRRLPLGQHKLDWLVVASSDDEQMSALPRTLERFPPANVLWAGNAEASYSARALDTWLTDNAIPVTRAEAGHTLDLGEGATLKVFAITSRGALLLVEWRNFRALLPIGLNFESLDELEQGRLVGKVSVLSMAGQGYSSLNPAEWFENLNPQLVVISVAAGDLRGNPSSEALEATEGYNILRTDLNGWIDIVTDGVGMWIEVQKK